MANEQRLIDANVMRDDWLQNGENEYVYDTNAVLESIDAQPTVDAAPVVHGRWIKVHEWCGVEVLKCSVCGREHPRLPTAYCCDCGTKMDGDRHE